MVTISPTNDPSVARNDSGASQETAPVTVNVLLNNSDPDGDDLTVTEVGLTLPPFHRPNPETQLGVVFGEQTTVERSRIYWTAWTPYRNLSNGKNPPGQHCLVTTRHITTDNHPFRPPQSTLHPHIYQIITRNRATRLSEG
jgi:hypothetical protein